MKDIIITQENIVNIVSNFAHKTHISSFDENLHYHKLFLTYLIGLAILLLENIAEFSIPQQAKHFLLYIERINISYESRLSLLLSWCQ